MREVVLCVLGLGLVACRGEVIDEPVDGNPPELTAALRVLHTVVGVPAIDVVVDDSTVVAGLVAGMVSPFVPMPDGGRAIGFRPSGTTAAVSTHVLALAVGDSLTILTIDSATVLNPWVLTDTGAVVPPNRSKLRALHFADLAPAIDIWRTQPDWGTPITFMFPHNFRDITPYTESDPGDWTVLVSSRQRQNGVPVLRDTLLLTDTIPVPAGESRTVIILDRSGGGLAYQVIAP
ncbi:MAG: DUF4397 domain-containing protein [Gemmatimonadota bacterium]|nr:DUF4397 domain-containing protein [Gemmatimonadota bacterium]